MNASILRPCRAAAFSFVIAAAAFAAAAEPALVVRVSSLNDAEAAIRGVCAAVGQPAFAEQPIAGLRAFANEGCDADPSRPVVFALAGVPSSDDGVFAVPGEEPDAERLAPAFEGKTPVRGADGVWTAPADGDEAVDVAMVHRNGYNVFAKPRALLAEADALLAAAPRFPGATMEATIRGEALRAIATDLDRSVPPAHLPFFSCETLSYGVAFDGTEGLFVAFAPTPAAAEPGVFADLAAAPALDTATALWRDDAPFAFAVSDMGRVFGRFFETFLSLASSNMVRSAAVVRARGAGSEESDRLVRETISRAEESIRLLRTVGASSGFLAFASDGTIESLSESAFRDSSALDRFCKLMESGAGLPDVPTNAYSFRATDEGWAFDFNPFAGMSEEEAADEVVATMRRFYGPQGVHGVMRRIAGPGPELRVVGATGPAGGTLPAPTGERPPDGAVLERFAPGARRVACLQIHMVDFLKFALSPVLRGDAAAIPSGGRLRWDIGVRDAAPVGVLAVDPAELRAYFSLFMLGVSRAATGGAPEPSGEEALFDD